MKQDVERVIAGLVRILLVVIVIALQVLLIVLLIRTLRANAIWVYVLIELASTIEMLILVSKNDVSAYTMAWLLVIALLPVFGYILYVLWGRSDTHGLRNDRTRASIAYGNHMMTCDSGMMDALAQAHPSRKRVARYLERMHFPLHGNTNATYYPTGAEQFDAILAELETAQRFIFIDFFIISGLKLWDRFYDVLARKAAQGIEIRIMYDDLGSIMRAPQHQLKQLRALGVQAVRFNPVHRFISRLYLNYRTHQKIVVVDGRAGFTGGTNIADEYVGLVERRGYWKDTGIRLEGDAVWSMTVTFLQMWDGETGAMSRYQDYKGDGTAVAGAQGFFQPFADGPVNNPDNPAEVMYRALITGATDYIYVTTPYLAIDTAMAESLCTAARSGVDVRVITPSIGDHWYTQGVTRSNYKRLLEAGVRVFEYQPGYIHGKTILSDDEQAVTGSINMDYRSFHLQYENAVWICGAPVLKAIKSDLEDTLAQCEEIRLDAWIRRPWYRWLVEGCLRVFAIFI